MRGRLAFLLVVSLAAQGLSYADILTAHSAERLKVCEAMGKVAVTFADNLAGGWTLDQLQKMNEISAKGDESRLGLLTILAEVADQYTQRSKNSIYVDVLHACVTQDGYLDAAIADVWLEVMPESHPNYAGYKLYVSMSPEQIDSFNSNETHLTASQKAELSAEILGNLPNSWDAFETRIAGELQACGYEYGLFTQDYVTAAGGIVFIKGSITLMDFPEKAPAMMLKVVPYDLVISDDFSTTDNVQFDIDYAYVVTPKGRALPDKETAFECELGGFCGAIIDGMENVFEGMLDGELSIVFQRREGGSDVPVPLVPDRVEGFNESIYKGANCFTELLPKVLKRLEE